MEFLIAIVVLSVILVTIKVVNDKTKQNKINDIIIKLSKLGTVTKSTSSSYNLNLEISNITYQVKLIFNSKNKEVSFNSNSHWQIKPNKKPTFINSNGFDVLSGIKIIILLNEPSKVVKYLNENEIVFVKPLEKCFSYYVFKYDEIELISSIKKEA